MEKYTQSFAHSTTGAQYDLTMLKEMDDNEYVVELLTILLSETPKDLKEMKDALRIGKTDIVCQKAHKLKGSAGIIQASELSGLLENIERIGKAGSINNELKCMVDNAATQYYSIEKGLKMHVAELK